MLAIRLRRAGSKRDPHYRVVVTDSRSSRDGRFVEILGHYHPRRQPAEVVLDLEKVDGWVARGAQMSDTVKTLVNEARRGDVPAAEVAAAAEVEAVDEPQEVAAETDAAPEPDGDAGDGAEDEERSDAE